jgi:Flp pilus assembly protein TadD
MRTRTALTAIAALTFAAGPALAQPPKVDPYAAGLAELQAGHYKEAGYDFDRILVRAPDDPKALMFAGMAMAGQNNLKGAQRAYEHALRFSDFIDVHRELGVTLVKMGDVKGAQEQLAKLKKTAEACKGSCKEAENLKVSVALVEKAISLAPAKPS